MLNIPTKIEQPGPKTSLCIQQQTLSKGKMCNTKAIFFDGTAEEKWNPSFGHLPRLRYFNKIEQISMERTHSANITSFHIFFFHIGLNKSCCHFRITDYIFFKVYLNIYIILLLLITTKKFVESIQSHMKLKSISQEDSHG